MLRRHGTKVLMKALRTSDVRISKTFLDTLDAHLRETVKRVCKKDKKSLDTIGITVVGTPPKPPIIGRKALDDFITDINGPTKLTKNFINEINTYAVSICIASLNSADKQTVTDINFDKKKVGQIPVTQTFVSNPIPSPPVDDIDVSNLRISSNRRSSLAIKYRVELQGVQIYGTQYLFTAKNRKQIEKSVTSIVVRHLGFIGAHGGVPIITIISIDKQIEK